MSKAKSSAVVPDGEATLTSGGSVEQGGVEQGGVGGIVSSEQTHIDQSNTGGATPVAQTVVDHGGASEAVIDDQAAQAAAVDVIKARVLVACEYGVPNDIVELSATMVQGMGGIVDADPAAVAYAESAQKV